MKSIFSILVTFGLLFSSITNTFAADKPTDFVDPFIGTAGIVHTFPGATVPFGMIQLSPDGGVKGWNHCSGYHVDDQEILGFSHNHLSGTGWSDLGDILLMPTVGTVSLDNTKYKSAISHDPAHERAEAGYYAVDLLDYGILAELTATDRVGIHRYNFPKTDSANVVIDPVHKIFGQVFDTQVTVVNDREIVGWCRSTGWGGERTVYFAMRFSQPFTRAEGGKKGFATFKTDGKKPIEVHVALSHVSAEGAVKNLATANKVTFDKARTAANKAWNDQLSNYKFSTPDESQKRILYTGLYHAMIQPNLNMDVDGRYVAGGVSGSKKLSGDVYTAKDFTNYSTFSFWDTFRAANPLLTLTNHKVLADIVKSLISRYENGGHLPVWELLGFDNTCMIGYPAVAIIGDAIMKEVPNFDYERGYQAMRDAAFTPYTSSSDGASGIEEYIKYGFVPAHIPISVAKTMEYSYYDWIIAQVAKKLGHDEDADLFTKRSMNFLNHWNPTEKLMWPKDSTGAWVDQNTRSWKSLQKHYISGNIYSYSFFYPHAVDTMISIYGGRENYVKALEWVLNTPLDMEGELHADISGFVGRYAHGDEPGHHFLYLLPRAGAGQKIAPWLHRVVKDYYSDARDGMPNNDDCGQMSSWYIFSAMGFYPLTPGDNRYTIGAPMLPGAEVKTASGKTFRMTAHNYTPENIYVSRVTMNGKPLTRSYITHSEMLDGGHLEFYMTNEVNED